MSTTEFRGQVRTLVEQSLASGRAQSTEVCDAIAASLSKTKQSVRWSVAVQTLFDPDCPWVQDGDSLRLKSAVEPASAAPAVVGPTQADLGRIRSYVGIRLARESQAEVAELVRGAAAATRLYVEDVRGLFDYLSDDPLCTWALAGDIAVHRERIAPPASTGPGLVTPGNPPSVVPDDDEDAESDVEIDEHGDHWR